MMITATRDTTPVSVVMNGSSLLLEPALGPTVTGKARQSAFAIQGRRLNNGQMKKRRHHNNKGERQIRNGSTRKHGEYLERKYVDSICTCGHKQSAHMGRYGICGGTGPRSKMGPPCQCDSFWPKRENEDKDD